MNKQLSYLLQHRGKRKKDETAELVAQLAPLEELDRQAAAKQVAGIEAPKVVANDLSPGLGSIIIEKANVPAGIGETQDDHAIMGIEPVVLAILALALVFIGFIAWQISLMPVE